MLPIEMIGPLPCSGNTPRSFLEANQSGDRQMGSRVFNQRLVHPADRLRDTRAGNVRLTYSQEAVIPGDVRTVQLQSPIEAWDGFVRPVPTELEAFPFPRPTRSRVHGERTIHQRVGLFAGVEQCRNRRARRDDNWIAFIESSSPA